MNKYVNGEGEATRDYILISAPPFVYAINWMFPSPTNTRNVHFIHCVAISLNWQYSSLLVMAFPSLSIQNHSIASWKFLWQRRWQEQKLIRYSANAKTWMKMQKRIKKHLYAAHIFRRWVKKVISLFMIKQSFLLFKILISRKVVLKLFSSYIDFFSRLFSS